MQSLVYLLLACHFLQASCHPHLPSSTSCFVPEKTESPSATALPSLNNGNHLLQLRDESNPTLLLARDTTEASDSTTSASETTSSESSTSTSDSATSSETTSASSTSTESTTSSSSRSSSSSTTTTSSTTTSTTTSTSTTSAELAEWNHAGNNRAIVFACCLLAVFFGIVIIHCALDKARARRTAARQLVATSTLSKEPLIAPRPASSTGFAAQRFSRLFREDTMTEPHSNAAGMAPRSSRSPPAPIGPDATGPGAAVTAPEDRRRGSPV